MGDRCHQHGTTRAHGRLASTSTDLAFSRPSTESSLQKFALSLRHMLNASLQPAYNGKQSHDCTQDVLELPSMEERRLNELFKDENVDVLSQCLNGAEIGELVLVGHNKRFIKLCVEKALNASRCKLYKTISQVTENANAKPTPSVLFKFQYLQPGYLRVCVMKASNLDTVKRGKMSTYVSVGLLPGDGQKFRSPVKSSSDPLYGFPAYFTGMSCHEISGYCLRIQVREQRRIGKDRVIGHVLVMLGDFFLTMDNVLELPFFDF